MPDRTLLEFTSRKRTFLESRGWKYIGSERRRVSDRKLWTIWAHMFWKQGQGLKTSTAACKLEGVDPMSMEKLSETK